MSLGRPEIILIWDQLPTSRDLRLRFESILAEEEEETFEYESVPGVHLEDVQSSLRETRAADRVATEVFDLWALMNCQPVALEIVKERGLKLA